MTPSTKQTDVHFVMQGKGGVGKTTAAVILAQLLREQDPQTLCIDVDPVNASFSDFKALQAETFEIEDNGIINTRAFDAMVQRIVTSNHPVVVDSGASTFLPLANYLTDSPVFRILARHGRRPVFHTIVTGGPGQPHTLAGLKTLLDSTPPEQADLVLWLNEYHGFGRIKDRDGRDGWQAIRVIDENRARFRAIVPLPLLNAQTYGADMQAMLSAGLTFREAIEGTAFEMMAQERLNDIWGRLKDDVAHAARH